MEFITLQPDECRAASDACSDTGTGEMYDAPEARSQVRLAMTTRRDLCATAGIFGSYVTIYFCSFGGSPLPFGFTCALLLSVLICALGSTADVFFIPQLNYLSALLRLPPDVAGITLLALGNGAPDVFTAVAVARETDFPLLLSDMLGGSVFTATVVLGAVPAAASLGCLRTRRPILFCVFWGGHPALPRLRSVLHFT